MSYAMSHALQAAVYQTLSTDPTRTGLVGTAIFDAMPIGERPSLYVVLGGETARDRSDQTGAGAEHAFQIDVLAHLSGFAQAKEAAGAVSDALAGADLTLTRGTLVGLHFVKAVAARVGSGDTRRITLTFNARLCDAPQSSNT
jgi:hypothetical protein